MIGKSEIQDVNHCSPKAMTIRGKKGDITCFSYETLVLIARMYNSTVRDKSLHISMSKSKKCLYKAINERLKPICGNHKEECWIEQPFIKGNATKYDKVSKLFRPPKPESWNRNQREWLNTYDILNVMQQYEEADKTFMFVGVFPIDFAKKNVDTGRCVAQEMCTLKLKEAWLQKKTKIGIVFNTDPSYKSGQHWISAFIGINPRANNFGVYYYDSVAMIPPKEIIAFMKQMKNELEDLHKKYIGKLEIRSNKIRKQYKDGDCGIFAMLFIILMMKHKFTSVSKNMGRDDEVTKFRDILYR